MYYFVDMYDNKLNFINNIDSETCNKVLDSYNSVKQVLDFYNLGKCVRDALDELIKWNNSKDNSGNYILRNLHTAERLVRSFLFEFRTCLDHIETEIKRTYGEDSEFWRIFESATSNAYDNYPEYAFTYHLRNCSQHCKNIVHGFNSNTGSGISSNTNTLLTEYAKWKQVDINFMKNSGDNIDLLKTFSDAFSAFNIALTPVIQYMLDTNNVVNKLLYIRKWGDSLQRQFKHDIHSFHIFNIIFSDGRSASKDNLDSEDILINGYPLDWETIYELSDSLTPSKQ